MQSFPEKVFPLFRQTMPFAVKDVLQHKRNERQTRELHEREYSKYVANLRQQTTSSHMSYLSDAHFKELERARSRNLLAKQRQYERIQRENNSLSERLFQARQPTTNVNPNRRYQQNLETFYSKYFQRRLDEYKRIDSENQLLTKRLNSVHGQVINKQQCNEDWQRQISIMKQNCDYPENIDRFVSNGNSNQQRRKCKSSRITGRPLSVLLGLTE